MSDLENYRDNLRHVVRPDDPSQRADSTRVTMTDYEALYLRGLLRTFANYGATDGQEPIARAYVEYIDMAVRSEGATTLDVYAHTQRAEAVLLDAVTFPDEDVVPGMRGTLRDKMLNAFDR